MGDLLLEKVVNVIVVAIFIIVIIVATLYA